jgi:hypothetical protein
MKKLFGNAVMVLLGLTMALGAAEMLLRVFPNLLPSEVRVNPPSRRVKALVDETYDFRQSDGDLFHYMQGKIVPLLPDQDQVVAQIHMITDENGFRNSPPEKNTYEIVALGDSFTRASGVAFSWTQKLAEYSESDVLNLGDVGFGPQDELKVLQQYGLNKQPQWVIMAYFEGNDLYDAAAYDQANPFILPRFGRYIINQSREAWNERQGKIQTEVNSNYQYPIIVTINNKDLNIAFFSYYIAWLSVDLETIDSSQDFRLVQETILQVQKLCEAADAHFLLVYIPSKEHIYMPYLTDANTLAHIFTSVPTITLDEEKFLQFTSESITSELINKHMGDQAQLMADFAIENDIHFLNLTPIFQEEASMGAELYYTFDTHWNQLGHELAAKSINKYIEGILSNSSSGTSGH